MIIKEGISKAKKDYKCDVCGKQIGRGTEYKRVPFPTGGYTHEHIDCNTANDAPTMSSNYNFEWKKH